MRKQKDNKFWAKVGILVVLIVIVAGFTLTSLIGGDELNAKKNFRGKEYYSTGGERFVMVEGERRYFEYTPDAFELWDEELAVLDNIVIGVAFDPKSQYN